MPDPSSPPTPDGPAFATARRDALEDAADLARLAPSIHNTQPWILVLADDRLQLRADRRRQVPVIDPLGRALVISVGAALLNARVAVATAGLGAEITRFPRPDDADLLAELRPVVDRPDGDLAALCPVIRRRHTNRRRFTAEQLPDGVLTRLAELARLEDVELLPVLRAEDRAVVARLTQKADGMQNADPAYRAELRRWTTRHPAHGDGVPPSVVPHVDGGQHDALPIRDFDTQGAGELPAETGSGTEQTLILLATASDTPMAWLRTGEALERILLELTRLGWVASPITQPLETPATRAELRRALTWEAHPQMLLRIGRAAPTTRTPRRGRADVVRNSTRTTERIRARQPDQVPEPAPSPARRPVSDGRGGTIWARAAGLRNGGSPRLAVPLLASSAYLVDRLLDRDRPRAGSGQRLASRSEDGHAGRGRR